jgi:hypothetical protein
MKRPKVKTITILDWYDLENYLGEKYGERFLSTMTNLFAEACIPNDSYIDAKRFTHNEQFYEKFYEEYPELEGKLILFWVSW